MFGKLQEANEKNRTFVLLLRIRGLGKELQGNINIDYKNYFLGFFLPKPKIWDKIQEQKFCICGRRHRSKLLWNLSCKKNEKERKTNERPGFNGLFNEREHQAAGKASGDGRNLRLLVPGISGTEKTE